MQKIQNLYEMFVRAASSLASPFLLIVRLYWGWQFMQTGWGKLGDLGKVTNYFTTLGIPMPAWNATFISGLEFAGGILLAIGLGSRFIAFLLAADMTVAYYLVASLIVLSFGPGKLALDAIIAKRFGQPPHLARATRPASLRDSVSIPRP
jgi:putative oxidoreductase